VLFPLNTHTHTLITPFCCFFARDWKWRRRGGLKPDTRQSYGPAVRSYKQFCVLTNLTPWPATRNSLGHWITGRSFGSSLPLQGQVQPTTIQSYVSALRSVHVDLGYDVAVFENSHLQRLI
jgi:hypothetical protein